MTIYDAARWEVVCLWTDFDQAIVDAVVRPRPEDDRTWSMRMIEVADRIASFREYLRPVEPAEVPTRLVSCGWFTVLASRPAKV